MNKLFLCLILSLLLHTFSAAQASAETNRSNRPLAAQAGWELSLGLNLAYSDGQSQLNTDDANAITDDLHNNGQAINNTLLFPSARLLYTFKGLQTQVFIADSREQVSTAELQYELGFTHLLDNRSKLTVAYFPQLPLFNDTWEDPYLTGIARTKTDENTQGGRLSWERIGGGPITLKYAFALTEVDNEQSGQSAGLGDAQLKQLQRDSVHQRIAVETRFSVASGIFVKPALQYTKRSADGKAHSFDQYGLQLAIQAFRGRHTLITTLSGSSKKFAALNPLFGKKQDSVTVSLFSVYSYDQAFNWLPLSFNILAGYNNEDSSIDFYDKNGVFIATGLTYKF
ncbi:DUF2860 domain-containing protein [Psychromonas sp.]|uniref:DUF2860 domain-containing protein n=1 Tax=Psychromonas sp. TaxID=1884585 RepID=UPI003563ED38